MEHPDLAARIAHFVTHRRRAVLLGLAALLLASVAIIAGWMRLDTEILNLLPSGSDPVETLKIVSQEFTRAQELTFALTDETNPNQLPDFAAHFAEMLRAEPWVERVFDQPPLEDPAAIAGVQQLALPLLLNLPAAEFRDAIRNLEPANLETRIQKLRRDLAAGSPRAEMELDFDPLGLVAPALKTLAGNFESEQTEPLTSPDGTLRMVFAITQPVPDEVRGLFARLKRMIADRFGGGEGGDFGPRESQALMQKVDAFNERVRASWPGDAPRILVTGQIPYVAELSRGMERDILFTLASSIALVCGVFYIGFRRFRPLLALVHVLLFCCIVSVALGALVFRELNGITIGFCSILVGLGVDFGMLLYGSYEARRRAGLAQEPAIADSIRHLGRGIFYGALTTAASFAVLLLSGSRGFAQLGVLVAFGIGLAGLFMATIFFVLLGRRHEPARYDWLGGITGRYVDLVFRNPKPILALSLLVLAGLTAFAFSPLGALRIEPNPRSLEPAHSRAGDALQLIQRKMNPGGPDPVIVMIDAADPQQLHDRWTLAQSRWAALVQSGDLRAIATPAPLTISPEQAQENIRALSDANLTAAREALRDTLAREGFDDAAFANAFTLLDRLAAIQGGDRALLDWRATLPPDSSWWFMLDRFFGHRPLIAAGYVTPSETIDTFEKKEALAEKLAIPGLTLHITGWSYLVADLIPWAKSKLVQMTAVMLLVNVFLLTFLYRAFAPLVTLIGCIALAIGAMLASVKLLALPLNLFNILAFPLVLGVGVDYGIYLLLAVREPGDTRQIVKDHLKPVLLSGLTSIAGFGSLAFAYNPSLSGLGLVCGLGILWSLIATLGILLPAYVWRLK